MLKDVCTIIGGRNWLGYYVICEIVSYMKVRQKYIAYINLGNEWM